MEYEEETGRDLRHEPIEEHRDYLIEEFDIDTSTQRMDSTFIEANITMMTTMTTAHRAGNQQHVHVPPGG